jgi:hypothetical protein
MAKFIPLYSFDNYIDAHIVLGQLEDCGIKCWLQDEHSVTTNPFLTNALGGIKLMVSEPDVEDVLQILKKFDEEKGNA